MSRELRDRQDAETQAFLDEAYANPGKWFKLPLHLGVMPLAGTRLAPDGTRVEITAALDPSAFDSYYEGDRDWRGPIWARRKPRPMDLPVLESDS